MNKFIKTLATTAVAFALVQCNNVENIATGINQNSIDIVQASGQLASGTSFHVFGSSTYDNNLSFGEVSYTQGRQVGPGQSGPKHGRQNGLLDGISLLAPTEELLAIIEAESAGDMRGMRMALKGGATVSNFDANGNPVLFPITEAGPHGTSFSGKEFPKIDSLLALIATTVVDYGTGVTFQRDSVVITRTGKYTINRSGTDGNRTETVTFDQYSVNDNKIEGTKTRVSTFNKATGKGESNSSVANGRITFSNGEVATWESGKSRISEIQFDAASGRPLNGTITTEVDTRVTLTSGEVLYSHKSLEPMVEKIGCANRKKSPVSGVLRTNYKDQELIINFGDGSCDKLSIIITLNGEVVERPVRN